MSTKHGDQGQDAAPIKCGGESATIQAVIKQMTDRDDRERKLLPAPIGPYRFERALGEGGMGEVYLAKQTKPLKRTVALKLIRLGMDTKGVIARFEAERQALALMNHSNVARVFDAGSTEQGRPYFVMEYVDGVLITKYCDDHRLTIDERLTLFMQVCEGVQHAHQKGIIHRDLKPSNVLVAEQDGKPAPKVIDFGLAKAFEQPLIEASMHTQHGQAVGTLPYMSPEQAEGVAADIDTRTDVYSLGVILYELLVGTLPHDPTTLGKAVFSEQLRILREVEPPKPSSRCSTLGEDSTEIAEHRSTTHNGLTRTLRNDLDWVVMKCLEKDRTRRYATTNALAMDVQRYLNNEPVVASPPSRLYFLKKFLRRHRGPAAAILGVVAVLSVGVAVSTTLYSRAQSEGQKSRLVTDLLRGMLAAVEPGKAHGRDVTVRQVLDEASKTIEERTAGHPEVQMELRQTMANTYYNLGIWASSKPHLLWLVQYYQKEFSVGHPTTLRFREWLGVNQFLLGEWNDALATFKETLVHAQQSLGDDQPLTVNLMTWMGNIYTNKRDYSHARGPVLRAYEIAKRASEEKNWGSVWVLCIWHRAILYHATGEYRNAEEDYLEAIETSVRVHGEAHLWTFRMRNELAGVYRSQGDTARCSRIGTEALAMCSEALGEEHPLTIDVLDNLAWAREKQGDWDQAEFLRIDALKRSRMIAGDHASTRQQLVALGSFLENQGRSAEAEPLFTEALRISRETTGEESAATIEALERLAAVAVSQGAVVRGRQLKEELVAALGRCAQMSRTEAGDLNRYAWALLTCEPVEPIHIVRALTAAQEANRLTQGKDPTFLDTLALAYKMNGQLEKAIEAAAAAVAETPSSSLPMRHELDTKLIQYLGDSGDVSAVAHARDRTERVYREELQRRREDYPDRRLDVAQALFCLGKSLVDGEKYVEAEPIVRECLAIRREEGSAWYLIGDSALLLGQSLFGQRKYDEAEPLLLEAYKLKRYDRAPPCPVRVVVTSIVTLYEAWGDLENATKWRAKLEEIERPRPMVPELASEFARD